MLELEYAQKKNWDAVLELVNTYSGLLGRRTLKSLEGTRYYFALINDEVVGLSGLHHVNSWLAEQVNTLVLPNHRHKGLGRELSSKVTEVAFNLGYGKVFCTVNTQNVGMVNIKKALRWVQEGHLRSHVAPGRDIYIFSHCFGDNDS